MGTANLDERADLICGCTQLSFCTIKSLNIRTPKQLAAITLKFEPRWLYRRAVHSKDAAGIANSIDPDQTAPLGAV